MPDFDFSEPRHTQQLWERQILPYWADRDRPAGQRFLGSVCVKQQVTDQILDIVGRNLKQLGRVTYHSLYKHFDEPKQNWLKILTFALSEYAYHYSSPEDKFWQGCCQRLNLAYGQGIEKTFRDIAAKGIDILGLVTAKGGYRYVSTLWLQSGIPKQNLAHFGQLVQEVSDEYGWWELAHTEREDLSQELLDFCQNKHPQWGTLIHFLKSSCSLDGEDEVEPISGQLVQGIATVAQELERKGHSPELLRDDNQREDLLGSYYLPQNFFLRNWDTLIRVLTPKECPRGNRRVIISRRKKPLSLVLDVANSLNIQLVLPEQRLGCGEWNNLCGTFCQIPEASWEGTIPGSGELMIPEQVIDVSRVSERWTWQLDDHRRTSLVEWHLEGVVSDFPCLMFDAWSGDRIPLHLPNPSISGTEEIICFTPRDVQLAFANGIEILDSCVPSSIRGWLGQHIRLTTKESSIVFPNSQTSQSISWKLFNNEQPQLKGLKLNGKKYTYLEIPTFWYPPAEQATSLNISISSLARQLTLINTTEALPPSNNWQSISLTRWITETGTYEARFWNQSHRWSYRFEIKSDYRLTSKPDINQLKLNSCLQGQITSLPIKYNASAKFWSEVVNFEGLWPLEVVTFSLSNRQDKVFYLGQADASGHLCMSLAVLHDCLPDSDWYALDYQQLGLEFQRVIEMETSATSISWTWASQAIQISGLRSDQLYSLSCWNLLLPQSQPVKLKIPLISQDEGAIAVPLNLPAGIYHIQLISSRRFTQNLGWWCGSQQSDLPAGTQADEFLENYCYTILGNEALEDFLNAAKALNLDLECQWIQTVIPSLQDQEKGYHFPGWLNPDALLEKLQALLQQHRSQRELILRSKTTEVNVVKKPDTEEQSKVSVKGNWHLVTLTQANKRGFFSKQMRIALERDKLHDLILRVEMPEEVVYQNLVLLELSNFKAVRDRIQQLGYVQRISPKPLTLEQVNQMLGLKKNVG